MGDQERERLRDLSTRLVRLHRVLLDRERRDREDRHGPIPSGELFRLVLDHEQFAWLRLLSAMIAQIDATVDADEPVGAEAVDNALRESYRLLKAGGRGDFQDKYHDALQSSPEVVMAHAEVSKMLRHVEPGNS
jgi:hypothetical protein